MDGLWGGAGRASSQRAARKKTLDVGDLALMLEEPWAANLTVTSRTTSIDGFLFVDRNAMAPPVIPIDPPALRNFLDKRPFQPFRITLTDGRSYEVRHPELLMVGRSVVVIGLPAPEEPEPLFDRFVTVSLIHIMQIEPLELQKSP
jgi:hypothetical protein